DRPHHMSGAARIVPFRRLRAPSSASAEGEPKLPASGPALVQTLGTGDVVEGKYVAEDEEVVSHHAVGRNWRVDVDERVVFDDPVSRALLRFDGVVPDLLESVADDLKSGVRSFTAAEVFNAFFAKSDANAIVGVDHMVVGDPDISQNVLGHEKRPVQRVPEVMMDHGPGHVRPDAHWARPVVVDVTTRGGRAVRRRTLPPNVPDNLKCMGSLGDALPRDGQEGVS